MGLLYGGSKFIVVLRMKNGAMQPPAMKHTPHATSSLTFCLWGARARRSGQRQRHGGGGGGLEIGLRWARCAGRAREREATRACGYEGR